MLRNRAENRRRQVRDHARRRRLGVPVISVVPQGEVADAVANRRDDADSGKGGYRLYEIAGAAHIAFDGRGSGGRPVVPECDTHPVWPQAVNATASANV